MRRIILRLVRRVRALGGERCDFCAIRMPRHGSIVSVVEGARRVGACAESFRRFGNARKNDALASSFLPIRERSKEWPPGATALLVGLVGACGGSIPLPNGCEARSGD